LIAVSLLFVENLGANAYLAASSDVVVRMDTAPTPPPPPAQPHIKLPKTKHCHR
jgi:hypothetical protein